MSGQGKDFESPISGVGASSRRGFLKGVGVAGLAASLSPLGAAETALRRVTDSGASSSTGALTPGAASIEQQTASVRDGVGTLVDIELRVNGASHAVRIDPRSSLLDCLRENLHLTGTKKGCDHGQCGACTVHINGRRANSCLSLALTNVGDEITTIEGLGTPDKLHPMQAAFVEHDAFQCGYCTSGQIMSAVAMEHEPGGDSEAELKDAMSGNICRCGAYANIMDAIEQARKARK